MSSQGCKRGSQTSLLICCLYLVCEPGWTPQKMEAAVECKPRPTPRATGIETMMKSTVPSDWDAETDWMTPMQMPPFCASLRAYSLGGYEGLG